MFGFFVVVCLCILCASCCSSAVSEVMINMFRSYTVHVQVHGFAHTHKAAVNLRDTALPSVRSQNTCVQSKYTCCVQRAWCKIELVAHFQFSCESTVSNGASRAEIHSLYRMRVINNNFIFAL